MFSSYFFVLLKNFSVWGIVLSVIIALIGLYFYFCDDSKVMFVVAVIFLIFFVSLTISKNVHSKKIENLYTTVTNIKNEQIMVTAVQYIDFVTLLDGKDGKHIEIKQYKVNAGYDAKENETEINGETTVIKPKIKIISSELLTSADSVFSSSMKADLYEKYLKPVAVAYEQKAKDYAVALNILENAKKGAEDFIKRTFNKVYVECTFETSDDVLDVSIPNVPFHIKMNENWFVNMHNFSSPKEIEKEHFNRDAFTISKKGYEDIKIRFGYSGVKFNGTYKEFTKNVMDTNSEIVEVFQFFDPMEPKNECMISFAQDFYRHFFILRDGKIYYLDITGVDSNQTMESDYAKKMVYLATSIKYVNDKDENKDYEEFVESYALALKNIKANESYNFLYNLEKLKQIAKNYETISDFYNNDDIIFNIAKAIFDEEYDASNLVVDDKILEDYFSLYNMLNEPSEDLFSSNKEKRIELLGKATHREDLKSSISLWFIDNLKNTDDTEIKQYKTELKENGQIASKELLFDLTEMARNEYYYNLFANRILDQKKDLDTSFTKNDVLRMSKKENILFAYTGNVPNVKKNDAHILELIQKRNNNIPINRNCFILIFTNEAYNMSMLSNSVFVNDLINDLNSSIHALVLDECTVRLFLNLDSNSFVNSVSNTFKNIFGINQTVMPIHFADWKKLKINENSIDFLGTNFETKFIKEESRAKYYDNNDFSDKSAIGNVLYDLQNEFLAEKNYHYEHAVKLTKDAILERVYDFGFRPSPRMILNNRKNSKREINY